MASSSVTIYPIIGSALAGASMFMLSYLDSTTPMIELILLLVFAGAGVGLMIQVALLAGQNDVEYRLIGVATGALNFFKSIGGAFGTAIFGAILSGYLEGHSSTIEGSIFAYDKVFFWTLPFMLVSFVLAIMMKEKPLSEEMVKVAEGSVEVPEY